MWNDLVVKEMSLSQAIRVVRGYYSSSFLSVTAIQRELRSKQAAFYATAYQTQVTV
jgi:hypothetical protein